MSIVSLNIRDNIYQIACDDGQERHLQHMATLLTARLNTLASALGKGNDNLLLVMVALMMENEIGELKKFPAGNTDASVAQAIDDIATYVETIAKNLEKY